MDIKTILKERFGFDYFRSGQEEVIRDVISGKDTIAILPTGSGKSLCYQLPAYALKGMILIISPLVALMEDQVAIMKRNGEKRVVALNSFLTYEERLRILAELATYKFVFVSPEMMLQQSVSDKLKNIDLALIVVDEAHCISQWGFDFRPDYLRVGEFFSQMNRPNMLALTATADDKVLYEINHFLRLENTTIHRHSLDRPNISYVIQEMASTHKKTEWILDRVRNTVGPGIIYVSSRKRADELAAKLLANGASMAAYHAGMEQEDRAFIQEQFLNGEVDWVCATNAFGMGIHKSNIRQIIHEHIPSTISGYTQEVGRAGRDGGLATATLLYTANDERRTRFIIQEDVPHEEEIRKFSSLLLEQIPHSEAAQLAGLSEVGKRVTEYYLERISLEETILRVGEQSCEKERQLQLMLQVVHSEICIRATILDFFGEDMNTRSNSCCSVCGTVDDGWVFDSKIDNPKREFTNWSERLIQLLGL